MKTLLCNGKSNFLFYPRFCLREVPPGGESVDGGVERDGENEKIVREAKSALAQLKFEADQKMFQEICKGSEFDYLEGTEGGGYSEHHNLVLNAKFGKRFTKEQKKNLRLLVSGKGSGFNGDGSGFSGDGLILSVGVVDGKINIDADAVGSEARKFNGEKVTSENLRKVADAAYIHVSNLCKLGTQFLGTDFYAPYVSYGDIMLKTHSRGLSAEQNAELGEVFGTSTFNFNYKSGLERQTTLAFHIDSNFRFTRLIGPEELKLNEFEGEKITHENLIALQDILDKHTSHVCDLIEAGKKNDFHLYFHEGELRFSGREVFANRFTPKQRKALEVITGTDTLCITVWLEEDVIKNIELTGPSFTLGFGRDALSTYNPQSRNLWNHPGQQEREALKAMIGTKPTVENLNAINNLVYKHLSNVIELMESK